MDRTTASLGTLLVTVKEDHLALATGAAVAALEDIMQVGESGTPAAPNSTVSFSGNFSFASRVYLHGDADCGAASGDAHFVTGGDTQTPTDEPDLRVMAGTGDDAVVTGTTMAVNVEDLDDPAVIQHLCIMIDPDADGAMPIPSTDAYTAMGSYMELADAAIGPAPEERTLGAILRNGTTIRLPYLSKHAKFHQRIRMVNRSSEDARYEIRPHGAGDVAGTDATGTLEANSIKVLSLSDDDVVTPANGSNTSATLIIEAPQGMVDVATVQVTRATGASDTVVYSP